MSSRQPPLDVAATDLSWTPLGRGTPVLDRISLQLGAGERVLLVGPSGSGKSTLLKAIAAVLTEIEPGTVTGAITVGGRAPAGGDGRVGLLVQDPADARVAGRVGRDVAFGPENLGVPRSELPSRVRWALAAVGFPYDEDHLTSALSGGEAQRLALAGVLALQPSVLLLDEPTSMLDAANAATVRASVAQALATHPATLIVVEHRLAGWVDLVDRLVVLGSDGRLVADGPVQHVLAQRRSELLAMGIWVPGAPDPTPLCVPVDLVAPLTPTNGSPAPGAPLVHARAASLLRPMPRGLSLASTKQPPVEALTDVDITIGAGRLHALRGRSGAGKSSLISLLVGLDAPSSGRVVASPDYARGADPSPARWRSRDLAARAGWVPQQAELTIVGNTVAQSMLATARALGMNERVAQTRARDLLDDLGLAHVASRNPHSLSGGEIRRVAIATALVHGPQLLALDEPTVGQDRTSWAAVAGLMAAAARAGVGVVVSTHDDALTPYVDQTTVLERGRVVS